MKKLIALFLLSSAFFFVSCANTGASFVYDGKLPHFITNLFDHCDGDCD